MAGPRDATSSEENVKDLSKTTVSPLSMHKPWVNLWRASHPSWWLSAFPGSATIMPYTQHCNIGPFRQYHFLRLMFPNLATSPVPKNHRASTPGTWRSDSSVKCDRPAPRRPEQHFGLPSTVHLCYTFDSTASARGHLVPLPLNPAWRAANYVRTQAPVP